MINKLLFFHLSIKNAPNNKLFGYFLLFSIIYQIISGFIVNLFNSKAFSSDNSPSDPMELFIHFFLLTLIASLIETIIFQVLIIEMLIKVKLKPFIAVIVSSIVFALIHTYNLTYILVVLPLGVVLGYYYYILRFRDKWIAFLSVFALHSAVNLFAYISNYFIVPLGK